MSWPCDELARRWVGPAMSWAGDESAVLRRRRWLGPFHFWGIVVGSKNRLLIIIIFNRTLYLRSLICLVIKFIRSLHSRQRHLEIARNEGFHYCYILFFVVPTQESSVSCNHSGAGIPVAVAATRPMISAKFNHVIKFWVYYWSIKGAPH